MQHVLTLFPQSGLEGATEALFKISDCNYWSHLLKGGRGEGGGHI